MLTSDNKEKEKDSAKSENKEKAGSEETAETPATDSTSESGDPSNMHATNIYPMKQVKRLKANQCRNLVR